MDTQNRIRKFVIETFLYGDDADLQTDTSFLENSIIDSTGILELVAWLEETFDIVIADDELIPENLDSLNNIVAFLKKKQSDSVDFQENYNA